ncbi:esterase-like activity of phytase family protein [Runella sp.]|uniref:esterase-like activity of phytase family protein n=1 Tax=Runella sp. TaxID=1960881 RepID=UPI003D0B8430
MGNLRSIIEQPVSTCFLFLLFYSAGCTRTSRPAKNENDLASTWQYEPAESIPDLRKDALFKDENIKSDSIFGGFSGIEYVSDALNAPTKGRWFLITDGYSKVTPRHNSYLYSCGSNNSGFPDWKTCQARALPLISAESVRYSKNEQQLYIVTENDEESTPSFHQFNPESSQTTHLPIQVNFKPDRGFESLALGTANFIWSIREQPEKQSDTFTNLTAWNKSGKLLKEFSYKINISSCAHEENGISELLIDPEKANTFLVLERCYDKDDKAQKNTVILYEVTAQHQGLTEKKVLFNFRDGLPGFNSDNLESMTWGPKISGKRTLVFISDDNFRNSGANPQFTRFLVLKEK